LRRQVCDLDDQQTSTGFSATYWLGSPKREEFVGPQAQEAAEAMAHAAALTATLVILVQQ
jgi:hypothetical protein